MTGKMTDYCKRLLNMTFVTYKSDETCLFLNMWPSKSLTVCGHPVMVEQN